MPYIPVYRNRSRFLGRGWRLVAAVFVVSLLQGIVAGRASAQELRPSLRMPTTLASVAAAADWASTYHALKYYRVREVNPLLRPFDREPAAMISLGGAIDVGLLSAWNLTVGRRNERVAAAGLWTMAAFRTYLAIHNMRNVRRTARRDSR